MKLRKFTSGKWDGIIIDVEKWDPAKADTVILATPTDRQRTPGQHDIKALTRDMTDGRWDTCFDPIVISREGWCINGLHRLNAVRDSGTTHEFLTIRNVPYRSIFHIDLGSKVRPPHVQAKLIDKDYTRQQLALACAFLRNPFGGSAYAKFTAYQQYQACEDHREAIAFAQEVFPTRTRGVTIVPVMSAIARAYEWGAAPEHLEAFAAILSSGAYSKDEPEGMNAVRLRAWLMEAAATGGSGGAQSKYRRAARALIAYIEGEVLSRLCEAGKDPFPLASDNAEAKAAPLPE